jgi:hypothetical protein
VKTWGAEKTTREGNWFRIVSVSRLSVPPVMTLRFVLPLNDIVFALMTDDVAIMFYLQIFLCIPVSDILVMKSERAEICLLSIF